MTETLSEGERVAEGVEPERAAGRSRTHRIGFAVVTLLACYLIGAYLVMPLWWKSYEHRHPALDEIPGITQTTVGIPADPLNVAVIGTKTELIRTLLAAGWFPADPLSLESSLKIAADTVMRRPYKDAPVSSLYLFGRKEDLAFEKPVGDDPRRRNHVRFWHGEKPDADGRPVWLGAATYDQGVGLSHTTGEVTHHIASDIDTERDRLISDLEGTGRVDESFRIADFHKVREGKNGGGDPWHTDGDLRVCVLRPE